MTIASTGLVSMLVGAVVSGGNLTVQDSMIVGQHDGQEELFIERFSSSFPYAHITAGSSDQNVGVGMKLGYRTTAGVQTDGLVIENNGNVTFPAGIVSMQAGAVVTGGNLAVIGDIEITGRVKLDAGTTNADAISWGTDYIYRAAAGVIKTDGQFYATGSLRTNGQVKMDGGTTNADGLLWGTDVNLYRKTTNLLKTDDNFEIGITGGKDTLRLTSTGTDTGITFGGDTNLYRSTFNTLQTDDHFIIGSSSISRKLELRAIPTHGMTGIINANTYGFMIQLNSTDGGLMVEGLTATTSAVDINAFVLRGSYSSITHIDSTKSTSSKAGVFLAASRINGTGLSTLSSWVADANLVVIADHNGTRWIVDEDGDVHSASGVGIIQFPDDYDDITALSDLKAQVYKAPDSFSDPLKENFHKVLKYNKKALEKAKLVTFNDDTDGIPFINHTRLGMFHTGAILQLNNKLKRMTNVIELLGEKLGLSPKELKQILSAEIIFDT